MTRPDADGDPALPFVPPEFHPGWRVREDPDELGYTFGPPRSVKETEPDELLKACNDLLPEVERAEITQAAILCHSGHDHNAERHRAAAGYDRL